MEKYGVTNVFQAENVKEKIKQTNLERYGFESAMNNKNVQEKLKKVFIEKYGTSMPMLIGRRLSLPHKKINEILTELRN